MRKGYEKFTLFDFPSCRSGLVLLTSTGIARETVEGRISVNEHYVSLSAVTGADEGSYTVMDGQGDIQRKVCLKVRGEKTNENRLCIFSSPMLDLF